MSALPLLADGAASGRPDHRESIRAVMLRVSRNLLRYQQIEHDLKLFLPNALPAASGPTPGVAASNKRKRAMASATLGTLLHFLSDALASDPGRTADAGSEPPSSADIMESERRIKDDRDYLVHHLGQSWLHDIAACRCVRDELDAAYARAERLSRLVRALLFEQLVALEPTPSVHESPSRSSANGDAEPPKLHLVSNPVAEPEQQAEAALSSICGAEWMPLALAGQRLYDQAPAARAVVKVAGGLRAWVGSKCSFELRSTTRVEIRMRRGGARECIGSARSPVRLFSMSGRGARASADRRH